MQNASFILSSRINMKKCYKCEEVKDLNHYYTDRTRKDGFTNQCKACKYKYDKEYSKILILVILFPLTTGNIGIPAF